MAENKEKDYLTHPCEKGSINISEEVVAMLAVNAAMEVEGVTGFYATLGTDIAEIFSKKGSTKGAKIQVSEDNVITVDLFVTVKLGCAVNEVAQAIQENVHNTVESATGFRVDTVNVNVCSVTLEKK